MSSTTNQSTVFRNTTYMRFLKDFITFRNHDTRFFISTILHKHHLSTTRAQTSLSYAISLMKLKTFRVDSSLLVQILIIILIKFIYIGFGLIINVRNKTANFAQLTVSSKRDSAKAPFEPQFWKIIKHRLKGKLPVLIEKRVPHTDTCLLKCSYNKRVIFQKDVCHVLLCVLQVKRLKEYKSDKPLLLYFKCFFVEVKFGGSK